MGGWMDRSMDARIGWIIDKTTNIFVRCEEGYRGNPALGETCQPCLCPDVQGSGRFFATSCQHSPQSLILTCICQEGHMGMSLFCLFASALNHTVQLITKCRLMRAPLPQVSAATGATLVSTAT